MQNPTNPTPPARSRQKPRPTTPPPILYDKRNDQEYTRSQLLGQGGFAQCFLGLSQDNRRLKDIETGVQIAIKCVAKASLVSSKQRQKLLSEIKIHQQMSHPNIVKFLSVFEDDERVYMILELCTNKTFVEMIRKRKRLSEIEVQYYMFQLLDGVRYMHRKGFLHRDIKLGNLFLDHNMKLKIGDFGLAAQIEHDGERKKTICGTPNYIGFLASNLGSYLFNLAPEILFDTKNGHSFEVDIWSLGVVMYTMLIGKPPFQTKDVKAIYKNIRDNQYDFPSDIPLSAHAKSMIQALLHTKPECRPSIDDILEHPFFTAHPMVSRIPIEALDHFPKEFARPESVSISLNSVESHRTDTGSTLSSEWKSRKEFMRERSLPSPPEESQPLAPPQVDIPQRFASSPKPERAVYSQKLTTYSSPKAEVSLQYSSQNPVSPQKPPIPMSPLNRNSYNLPTSTRSPLRNIQKSASMEFSKSIPKKPSSLRLQVSVSDKENSSEGVLGLKTGGTIEKEGYEFEQDREKRKENRYGMIGPTLDLKQETQDLKLSTLDSIYQFLKSGLESSLETQLENLCTNGITTLNADPIQPKLFITKWIDYTTKYGLSYQLCDGSVGVYFNDGTSMILSSDSNYFEYLYTDRKGDRPTLHRRGGNLQNPPMDLAKKITLLQHFKGYMAEKLTKAFIGHGKSTGALVYLVKYLRTKNGVLFRLSDNTLQLNLFDHTKIIVDVDGWVTFVGKNREMETRSLGGWVGSGRREVLDRVVYCRDIVGQMVSRRK